MPNKVGKHQAAGDRLQYAYVHLGSDEMGKESLKLLRNRVKTVKCKGYSS